MSSQAVRRFVCVADAMHNPKLEILKGQIRKNAPPMAGLFCKTPIAKGEFLCSWGGVTCHDGPILESSISNLYDVVKYALTYTLANGKVGFVCVRLTSKGEPIAYRPGMDYRDGCMAVYMNEPSPTHRAFNQDGQLKIEDLKRDKRNLKAGPNVCLKLHQQSRPWIVCPVIYALRNIDVGEELVWCYGPDYDRRLYDINYDDEIFQRSVDEYDSYKDLDGACTGDIQWELIHFQKYHRDKLQVRLDTISPDMFLHTPITELERAQMSFRTIRYREQENIPDMITPNAPTVSETKRRQRKVKSITNASLLHDNLREHDRIYKEIHDIAYGVVKDFTVKKFKKTLQKYEPLLLRDTLLEHIFGETGYAKEPMFVLRKKEAEEIMATFDPHWIDILRMQKTFWLNLKNCTTTHQKFSYFFYTLDPDTYAGIFLSIDDAQKETAQNWNDAIFLDKFKQTRQIVHSFFNVLVDIKKKCITALVKHTMERDQLHGDQEAFTFLEDVLVSTATIFDMYKLLLKSSRDVDSQDHLSKDKYATFKRFLYEFDLAVASPWEKVLRDAVASKVRFLSRKDLSAEETSLANILSEMDASPPIASEKEEKMSLETWTFRKPVLPEDEHPLNQVLRKVEAIKAARRNVAPNKNEEVEDDEDVQALPPKKRIKHSLIK